jgi:two-component system, sensor histidine kinase PdtaS
MLIMAAPVKPYLFLFIPDSSCKKVQALSFGFVGLPGILFLFLFCLPGYSLHAQESKIDSLTGLIKTDKEDTSKVKHLNQLSWSQKSIGLYKEALASLDQSLKLAQKENYKKGIADSYNLIGVVYLEQGDSKHALENYMLAMEIRKETGDAKGIAALYNNIGIVEQATGNYGKALENYKEAAKINKQTGNKNWLANNYNNIANAYAESGKNDEALENYLLAKKIKEEINEKSDPQYANIINNIGNSYFFKADFVKALEIFKDALKIREQINDKRGVGDSYLSIGSVFFEQAITEHDSARQQDLYAKTFENFSTGLKLKEKLGDLMGITVARLNMGSLYLKQKKTGMAHQEFLAGLAIAKENRMNDITMNLYQLLSQSDSLDGNWKGAYEYQRLHKQYSDSVYNEENSKKLAEMTTRFETEKKEAQINVLEEEKKRTRLFMIIFAILFIGILFLAKRAYDNKKKVAEFMSRENERKEVMIQEVHHRINNNLQIISSLLTLQAHSAGDEKLRAYLKQSQNRIQSLSSLHELLYQTDSPLEVNMVEYLNRVLDFHRDVLKTLPGRVELITNIADTNFGTKISVPLALIVNELVTNSIKYAFSDGADGKIEVTLAELGGGTEKWLLRVSDTGKGLPEDTGFRKDSLGLRLVTIMTKQIHGVLVRSNNPGATFEITFKLTK